MPENHTVDKGAMSGAGGTNRGWALFWALFPVAGVFGADKCYVRTSTFPTLPFNDFVLQIIVAILLSPVAAFYNFLNIIALIVSIISGGKYDPFLYPKVRWSPVTGGQKTFAWFALVLWILLLVTPIVLAIVLGIMATNSTTQTGDTGSFGGFGGLGDFGNLAFWRTKNDEDAVQA
jgi:hypothetical protein